MHKPHRIVADALCGQIKQSEEREWDEPKALLPSPHVAVMRTVKSFKC